MAAIDHSLNALTERQMALYGNCAQASFHVLHEHLRLPCDESCLVRALTPFPGVGLTGETCGAVSGALLALGLSLGATDSTDKEQNNRCMKVASELCVKVSKELGSTRCGDIMERQFGRRFDLRDPLEAKDFAEAGAGKKCTQVVQSVVRVAATLLSEEGQEATSGG